MPDVFDTLDENQSEGDIFDQLGEQPRQGVVRPPDISQALQFGQQAANIPMTILSNPAAGLASQMGQQEGPQVRAEDAQRLRQQFVAGGGPIAGLANIPPYEINLPRVSGNVLGPALAPFGVSPDAGDAAAALVNTGEGLVEGGLSPIGVATMAAAPGLGRLGQIAAGVGFGAPAIKKGLEDVYKGVALQDPQQAIEGGLGTLVGGWMVAGGFAPHGETATTKGLNNAIQERSAEALPVGETPRGGGKVVEGAPAPEKAPEAQEVKGQDASKEQARVLLNPAEQVAEETGWTLKKGQKAPGLNIPDDLSGYSEADQAKLKELVNAMPKVSEFTDRNLGSATEGLTVYEPENATPEQIRKHMGESSKGFNPAPTGMVRLWHGEGGVEGAGSTGSSFTENHQYAANFGPKQTYVDVPKAVYDEAVQKAKAKGTPGDLVLDDEWVKKSKLVDKPLEMQTHEIGEVETAPGVTVQPNPQGKPEVHIAGKPLPAGATLAASFFSAPAGHPLGPLTTISARAAETLQYFTESIKKLPESVRVGWRAFSMQSLPRITASDRATGESGVRYAVSPQVGRAKGLEFAGKVTDGIKEPLFDQKLGTALTEDNLRSKKQELQQRAMDLHRQAYEANVAGDTESANALREQGQQAFSDVAKVTSLIGAERSPFRTEEQYQQFLNSPAAKEAIARHKQLWEEQKDPLFRKANDLDPDVELPIRGLQTGARVNLKAIQPGETTKTGVGRTGRPALVRQAATLLRRDPFARQMKGTGQVYEGSYAEIMGNGFEKEYPVAAQHDFIKSLLDSGNAVLSQKEFPKDLSIKGEETKGYLMKLKAWRGQWLQIRRSLAPEYESVSGLTPAVKLPYYTKSSEFLTNQSVKGLAEGSVHVSNLMTTVLTGLGPTANPMLNALIKSAGRADVLWSLPKVLIKGFTNQKAEMLRLAEIGAAKEPYGGSLGWFINKIDQGVRLTAADTYTGMADKGWVPKTETGLREFVNQAGQYSKKLQPRTIQVLRETGVQPFATAIHNFNVQGIRTAALGPAAKGTSNAAALALRADKAAGIIGFFVLSAAINKMVSGSATGPKGTPLGSVGWVGDDKKVHTFNLSRLFGYARSGQVTGIQPAIEARRLGLTPNQSLAAGLGSVAGTALNYVSGPLNRTATIAKTGKRPGVPMVQEAPVVSPRDDMAPLKSQAAANVIQALQEANPAVDAAARYMEGKPLSEIAQRQFSRYTPRTGMSQETIAALPKIVKSGEIQNYVDQLTKDARKLPLMERGKFIYDKLDKDEVQPEDRADVLKRLRIKGVWRYE